MRTKFLLVTLALVGLSNVHAQNGPGTTTSDNSGISEVETMSKGLTLTTESDRS